jgi:hypothetical protein
MPNDTPGGGFVGRRGDFGAGLAIGVGIELRRTRRARQLWMGEVLPRSCIIIGCVVVRQHLCV